MNVTSDRHGMGGKVQGTIAEAIEWVKEALKTEGFGVLTEIDLQATMKAKLDIDRDPYVILGACNPPLAKQALDLETDIGLVMPCNVIVREVGGEIWVKAIDPTRLLGITENTALDALGSEVREKLKRALSRLPD